MDREQFFRCEFCGERIGVYERIVVNGRGTTVTDEPNLRETRPTIMHIDCSELAKYDAAEPD